MSRRLAILGVVVLSLTGAVRADDAASGKREHPRPRGIIRLGVFYVTGISTKVLLSPQEAPLGIFTDLQRDLGVSNSYTSPSAIISYRFAKKQQLDAGWYGIKTNGQTIAGRNIEIGDIEIPLGAQVTTRFETEILKVGYTWVFHEDRKVTLGLTGGLYIASFFIDLEAETTTDPLLTERASVTAPLPVAGTRFGYRINRKLSVLATFDLFFLNYDKYKGALTDARAFVEHRTSRRFGFGAGFERFALDVEIDDDPYWEIRQNYSGFIAYLAIYLGRRDVD